MAPKTINRGKVEIGAGEASASDLDATNAAFREAHEDANGRTAPTNNSKSVMDQLYEYFSSTPGCGGGGLGLGALWGASPKKEEFVAHVMENSIEDPETGTLYAWKFDLMNHDLREMTVQQKVSIFTELARQMESGVRFDNDGLQRCISFAKSQKNNVKVDEILKLKTFGMLRTIREIETRDVLDVLYEATHDESLDESNENRKSVYTVIVGGSRALCVICRPKGEALEVLCVDVMTFHGRGAAMMSFKTVDHVIDYCQRYFQNFASGDTTKYKAIVISASVAYAQESAAGQKLGERSVEDKGKDTGAALGASGKSSMANRVIEKAYGSK